MGHKAKRHGGLWVFEQIEILKNLKKTWWSAQAMNNDKTS
jgi:hypothetical protein